MVEEELSIAFSMLRYGVLVSTDCTIYASKGWGGKLTRGMHFGNFSNKPNDLSQVQDFSLDSDLLIMMYTY